MILAAVFGIFAIFGLILIVLDFAAKANSAAPSMYNSGMTETGCGIFVICSVIALACWASFAVIQ